MSPAAGRAKEFVVSVSAAEGKSAREVVQHIRAAIAPEGLAALLVFFAPQFDSGELATCLKQEYGGVPVYGCTTAGELSLSGMCEGSVVAMGFPASDFCIVGQALCDLEGFGVEQGRDVVQALRMELGRVAPEANSGTTFGLLLLDGMTQRAEAVVSALYASLDDIPLVGGSAGDDLRFEQTFVICDGVAKTNAAVMLLVHTELPFRVFKCNHFEPTNVKMVVTEADIERRIVYELNAEPAAEAYAHAIGTAGTSLDKFSFATHPVVVRVGGEYFARSVQQVNADGSLSFFCAIDEGLVLTAAIPRDMLQSVRDTFDAIEADMGEAELYLGFDCVHRKLDAEQRQITRELSALYQSRRVIGFNTYGEQFRSMHLNQTLTGVALGRRRTVS